MQYYSTKDMCKIFGVGRETLRHYENVGLLHPAINPENGYRQYGYWDVGTMIDILKYKSGGFSLNDTRKAIFEMEFFELADALEQQQDYYKAQIERYRMLDKKASLDLHIWKQIQGDFGALREFDVDDMFFIPYMDPLDNTKESLYKTIFQNGLFFSTAWIFSASDSEDKPIEGLGFITEKIFANFLRITDGITLPKFHAIGTILDVKGQVEVCKNTFLSFEKKVSEKYLTASAKTYASLVSRFFDSNHEYHQYIIVCKKLENH